MGQKGGSRMSGGGTIINLSTSPDVKPPPTGAPNQLAEPGILSSCGKPGDMELILLPGARCWILNCTRLYLSMVS